jgi:hypothetical protein
MPVIACPGCGKQYKMPANAAGQMAKCACGKRFKLGASPPAASSPLRTTKPTADAAAASPQSAIKPPKSTPVVPVAALASDDDFWNEGLKPIPKSAVVASPPPRTASPPKKRPKKENPFRWGFDGGKFVGGLLTFLIAGGITAGLVMTTGYLYFWPAGIAIAGLLSALSGLMGD